MRFNFDDYRGRGKRYAMRCRNRAEAEIFLTHLDSLGKHWESSGRSYLDFDYSWDPRYPCYIFRENLRCEDGRPQFTYLEFSDFDWDDTDSVPDKIEIAFDDLF